MVTEKRKSLWKRWTGRLGIRSKQRRAVPTLPFAWETALNTIEDWICVIDLRARIIRSNGNSRNVLDLPPSRITGETCCRVIHNTDSPLPACPLRRMIASKKRESDELETQEGRWMFITVDPIFSAAGEVIGAVHISRDITRRILIQNERERLVKDLKQALQQIKTLSGLLPICSSCKKIRDDTGYWNLIENYIETHSHASFSHSLCPDCMEEIYGEETWFQKIRDKRR